jgi:AcrR family transcriptional regulator
MFRVMNAQAARPYTSPLRAEQAAMTRDRIIDAAVDLLSAGEAQEIGMSDVADHAGVSVRTVYRYFATREDLFDAVVDAIGERMAAIAGPPPGTPGATIDSVRGAVGAVYELEPLYRALFATQAGRESHRRTAVRRRAAFNQTYGAETAGMGKREARMFGALAHLVTSSTSVLFLKDYWELEPDEAGRALKWALTVLIDAARDPQKRGEL